MHQANRSTFTEASIAYLGLPRGANTSESTMTAYRPANASTSRKGHA
jgi:hypothetical protein